jgi:hypothetical protein
MALWERSERIAITPEDGGKLKKYGKKRENILRCNINIAL